MLRARDQVQSQIFVPQSRDTLQQVRQWRIVESYSLQLFSNEAFYSGVLPGICAISNACV